MKCSRCGGEIPDNSGYCNLCGAKQRGEKEKLIKKPQLKTFAQCLVESEEGPKGRAKDPIKMNTLNGYGDKSPIKKKMQAKKVLIICVVSFLFIALVACVMDYFSQSPFESMAIQHAKELKRMLKDPDSMMIGNILCISVLIENSSGELETQVFTYIEYNAKNGYGAYAGTQIDYFDHGKYMGDVYDRKLAFFLFAEKAHRISIFHTIAENIKPPRYSAAAVLVFVLAVWGRTYCSLPMLLNMSAAFYTRRRQCFTVAAEKFDTCGGGI